MSVSSDFATITTFNPGTNFEKVKDTENNHRLMFLCV